MHFKCITCEGLIANTKSIQKMPKKESLNIYRQIKYTVCAYIVDQALSKRPCIRLGMVLVFIFSTNQNQYDIPTHIYQWSP